ncbi:hypothetical protein RBH26_09705 [Natronolimnohabitans sp. A-GB9]|uniref:hypothetical protein n=1 Tax=Natronolimnohabitans sp. A-GB9 TaxID=3069757 RepID=UPI0027AE95E8|nr:hypothetical protein [Natronolimnohabitans sp. A-GB9]MDQ2050761.1 hypothetical protein [Natronolimnohabitans sp. A-GB9]
MSESIAERLHQPEYTGENRCEACTVVNVIIAIILGGIISRKSKLVGVFSIGMSLVLIYLRGYLVPKTPTLTKRYLPAAVLQWFGKESERPPVQSGLAATEPTETGTSTEKSNPPTSTDSHTEDVDPNDELETTATEAVSPPSPEEYFLEQFVLEPCADEDDLCLTEEFTEEWNEQIAKTDSESLDATDAARTFGFDTSEQLDSEDEDQSERTYEIEEFGDAQVLKQAERTIGQWPSQAALVADVTAAHVLNKRDPQWDAYPPEAKGSLLNGLRMFLETCPTSGDDTVMRTETVESCCQSHEVVAVTCEETGERLFEHPIDEIEA